MYMHKFILDSKKCVSCGACARDCLFSVLEMRGGNPVFAHPERCIGCLHCYAVCPAGAISMDGNDPAKAPADAETPSVDSVKAFIRQRRSIRSFKRENIDPATIREMLETAWSAPSGVNQRMLRVSIIDDRSEMDAFRRETYARLAERTASGTSGAERLVAYLGADQAKWLKNDVIFRGAPHLVVVSCAQKAATGIPDCFIYLSYLEMLACAGGFGTLWCGILYRVLGLAPELAGRLGIPAGHEIGYAMLLGIPAVRYARGLERRGAEIHLVRSAR